MLTIWPLQCNMHANVRIDRCHEVPAVESIN
ncbi:hypothetical protein ATHEMM101B_13730 [Atlantibacter hermannii]|nr:Uncharacterised protein [Atlantibacter hermannii]